jgi:hypothetical protein
VLLDFQRGLLPYFVAPPEGDEPISKRKNKDEPLVQQLFDKIAVRAHFSSEDLRAPPTAANEDINEDAESDDEVKAPISGRPAKLRRKGSDQDVGVAKGDGIDYDDVYADEEGEDVTEESFLKSRKVVGGGEVETDLTDEAGDGSEEAQEAKDEEQSAAPTVGLKRARVDSVYPAQAKKKRAREDPGNSLNSVKADNSHQVKKRKRRGGKRSNKGKVNW